MQTTVVCCPSCGHYASLRDHTIKPTGEVEPSLVRPYDDCDYLAFVVLDHWPGEEQA